MGLIFKKSSAQPNFTVAAAIVGTPEVGETLECTYTVVRAKASNVTVRWYSYNRTDGVAPTGETLLGTGLTYVLTGNEVGKYIRAIVTASNPAGTVQSTSSYTAVVTNTETPPEAPTIASPATISGTVEVGSTLTVAYDFDGETSVAIQWYSYTSQGGSVGTELGTSSTQALTVAEDGKWIGCEVTAENAAGPTKSTATRVGPVAALSSEAPSIVSAAVVSLDEGADGYNEGEYIICDATFSGHTSTPTFVWYKCDAGKANPQVITLLDGEGDPYNAGEDPIRPLFVSEPNHWRGALFLDTSLGLNIGGKYVYCVATAANGVDSTPSESAAVGPIGAIQGAPITQAMVGDGPYVLPLANTTYYLAEDISTNGTAFIANKAGQKLNLNGKTVTFDNAAPTGLVNGGFETGNFTGWDVTNAPSASIFTVTDPLADWNRAFYNSGSYSCRFSTDIHQAPITDEYIEQTGITLVRNKWYAFTLLMSADDTKTITVTLSVRKGGQTLWENWSRIGEKGRPWRGWHTVEVIFQAYHEDPTYDFRITVTGNENGLDELYLDDIQLTSTRCSGFAAITPGTNSFRAADVIELVDGGSGYADGTYTGVQSVFASGSSLAASASYPKLDITVSGGAVTGVSLNTGGNDFFDHNTVVTVPAASVGGTGSGFTAAITGLRLTSYTYGFCSSAKILPFEHATRFNVGQVGRVVKNGVITQGQHNGTFATAVCTGTETNFGTNDRIKAHRLTCTVTGHNSNAVNGLRGAQCTIADSTLSAMHGINANRDYALGSAVMTIHGTFARNTVYHSGGGGYYTLSSSTAMVYGNRFHNRMRYSNQSCLNVIGIGTKVHDNIFDNTGDYYGRCMHLGCSGNVEIYNNTIKMQPSLWNSEYAGTNAGGDHAVQFELESRATPGAVNFHDNTLEAYAPDEVPTNGEELLAGAIRWSGLDDVELTIRNNTLLASAAGRGYAWIWFTRRATNVKFDIRDNSVTTNSGYWVGGNNTITKAYRESVTLLPVVADDARLFVLDIDSMSVDGEHVAIDLVDVVASPSDFSTLTSQGTWVLPRYGARYELGEGRYRIKWTTTIATGAEGAAVVIKDSGNVTVASGTSEADGTFVAELQQYYIFGTTTTNTGSYTVTVNANPPVAFTADSVKTINAPA